MNSPFSCCTHIFDLYELLNSTKYVTSSSICGHHQLHLHYKLHLCTIHPIDDRVPKCLLDDLIINFRFIILILKVGAPSITLNSVPFALEVDLDALVVADRLWWRSAKLFLLVFDLTSKKWTYSSIES